MASCDNRRGRVVVINGGSSAGKTSLGRALQAALSDPWLLLGIDLFLWMLPPAIVGHPEGLSVRQGVITRSARFMSMYWGFRASVAALAHNGVDVLVDDVALDGVADQRRWDEALEGLEVVWVGVRCAPAIAAQREARRGSRLPGTARHQAQSVHAGVRYDVEVDSGVDDVRHEVELVIDSLQRKWAVMLGRSPRPGTTLPHLSAWAPGQTLRPPPWER